MVDDVLGSRGLRVSGLDGIAFGQGPGSFTGLRIACGIAQGLAFAAELPVAGIDTLLAMAQSTQVERVVCCLDARMREIYHAAYERSDTGWKTVCSPAVCAPAEAPPLPAGSWVGCGSGFEVYREVLMGCYDGRISSLAPGIYPHAREIARLAVPVFEAGNGMDAALAAPVYVRDKVALRTDER